MYPRQPERDDAAVHGNDHGLQYVSIRYSERLAEVGTEPLVGGTDDSYDNALAETINGLYKAELMHRRTPWKTKEAIELATLEHVPWCNRQWLLEPIGYIPLDEADANYSRQRASAKLGAVYLCAESSSTTNSKHASCLNMAEIEIGIHSR